MPCPISTDLDPFDDDQNSNFFRDMTCAGLGTRSGLTPVADSLVIFERGCDHVPMDGE